MERLHACSFLYINDSYHSSVRPPDALEGCHRVGTRDPTLSEERLAARLCETRSEGVCLCNYIPSDQSRLDIVHLSCELPVLASVRSTWDPAT